MSSFMILALASSALAFPFGGDYAHVKHRHDNHVYSTGIAGTGIVGTGTGAPYPYPVANATGIYTAGTSTAVISDSPEATGFAHVVVAAADESTTSCSQSTTYVTETNRVTVTVQRTSSTDDSAETTATADLRKKGLQGKQRWRKTSTTITVAATTTTAAAATTATSASVAPTTSVVAASTTSSAAAAASSVSSLGGKRGVAYNDASLTTPFEGSSQVSWGYNWGQSSSGLSSKFNFVPLLWGTSSTFTNGWAATVSAAAAKGVTHLMSFNEPDHPAQANLSPADAAAAYKKYMQPYAGQFKLGAPAVTNGGGAMGLSWLDAFITACDGCTIDFVCAHWYDSASNTGYFKDHIANASAVAGGKPVWVTEFGATSGSDSEISTFLETVMPWMDSQDYVERYAYFMVSNGLLVSGGSTTGYGSTYASYTG